MVQRIFLSGNASLDPDKWYSVRFLAERWDVHPETPWKWVSTGHLPPPTKLGPKTSRWSGAVIEAFEYARQQKRARC